MMLLVGSVRIGFEAYSGQLAMRKRLEEVLLSRWWGIDLPPLLSVMPRSHDLTFHPLVNVLHPSRTAKGGLVLA